MHLFLDYIYLMYLAAKSLRNLKMFHEAMKKF